MDEAGNLTAEAGPFAGTNVLKDANPTIIEALEGTGLLLKQGALRAPLSLRLARKKPTIFRTTEQWFASVEGFRAAALEAIARIRWLPASGRNRIEAMVSERGDWCISRQRTARVCRSLFSITAKPVRCCSTRPRSITSRP